LSNRYAGRGAKNTVTYLHTQDEIPKRDQKRGADFAKVSHRPGKSSMNRASKTKGREPTNRAKLTKLEAGRTPPGNTTNGPGQNETTKSHSADSGGENSQENGGERITGHGAQGVGTEGD